MEFLLFFAFFGFICYPYDIGEGKSDFYSFPAEKNFKRILHNKAYTLTSSGFFFFFFNVFYCNLGDSFAIIMVYLFIYINCLF
jgi:hypothetical protein